MDDFMMKVLAVLMVLFWLLLALMVGGIVYNLITKVITLCA